MSANAQVVELLPLQQELKQSKETEAKAKERVREVSVTNESLRSSAEEMTGQVCHWSS